MLDADDDIALDEEEAAEREFALSVVCWGPPVRCSGPSSMPRILSTATEPLVAAASPSLDEKEEGEEGSAACALVGG